MVLQHRRPRKRQVPEPGAGPENRRDDEHVDLGGAEPRGWVERPQHYPRRDRTGPLNPGRDPEPGARHSDTFEPEHAPSLPSARGLLEPARSLRAPQTATCV